MAGPGAPGVEGAAKSGWVQVRLVVATCVLWAVGTAQIVMPVAIARHAC